jgi:hypothetical protein
VYFETLSRQISVQIPNTIFNRNPLCGLEDEERGPTDGQRLTLYDLVKKAEGKDALVFDKIPRHEEVSCA